MICRLSEDKQKADAVARIAELEAENARLRANLRVGVSERGAKQAHLIWWPDHLPMPAFSDSPGEEDWPENPQSPPQRYGANAIVVFGDGTDCFVMRLSPDGCWSLDVDRTRGMRKVRAALLAKAPAAFPSTALRSQHQCIGLKTGRDE